MKNTLIISAHPHLDTSNCNKHILNLLKDQVENANIRHLADLYPDHKIDVEAEQQALLDADVIVLQFPFYWYSVPGILKQWMDDVLTYGFAYGSTGDKLKGKDFLLSFTIGGPEESYRADGYNTYEIEQLLYPLKQTANLAQVNWIDPIYSHGMVYIPDVYNTLETVLENAQAHGERLIAVLKTLQS